MLLPILCLGFASFVIAWIMTWVMIRLAPRLGFVDKPGGRKIHANPKPLGGGIAIFTGVALPMLAMLALLHSGAFIEHLQQRYDPAYIRGARAHTDLALGLLGTMLAMHILGLLDDRRALGPYLKLFVQLAVISLFVIAFDCRALTTLDHLGFGR